MRSPEEVMSVLRGLPGLGAVVEALAGEGGVHVVGGAVRDVLLEREPRELDVVVEGDAEAVARRAARRLDGEVVVHDRFGTATVRTDGLGFDVAAARAETYERPGALPTVRLGVALGRDLARRDFTVNALAVALADGAFGEWPGGLADLRAGRLRVLHPGSFLDDPTRLLRLARYAARLGFAPAPGTRALAQAAVTAGALAMVAGGRSGGELRLLAREPQPAALLALDELGAGRALLGPRFSVSAALVRRALALCPRDARADLVALAACLRGEDPGERLDALAFPARERDVVRAAAVEAPGLARALAGAKAASEADRLLAGRPVEGAVLAGAVDDVAEGWVRRYLDEWRGLRLAVGGDDLVRAGLEGPAVGAGLAAARAAVVDGRAGTREEQLAAALAGAAG